MTAIPDEAPTALLRRFEPLGAYLGERLDRPVEFVPVVDHAAAVEALVSSQVDLAWLGGFTFVRARRRSGGAVQPLVQRVEDEHFRSVFVTRADSGIDSLEDLRGRDLAFGSPSSTSGHLMPRHWSAGPSLDAAARDGIAEAFLVLSADDPAEAELLALRRASGYVPTEAGNYADIEAAARAAGLID